MGNFLTFTVLVNFKYLSKNDVFFIIINNKQSLMSEKSLKKSVHICLINRAPLQK